MREGGDDGAFYDRGFLLSEVPVLVKASALVARWPLNPDKSVLGRGTRQYDFLEFTAYPCGGNSSSCSGSTSVYEDDGVTMEYLSNIEGEAAAAGDARFVWTSAEYTR